MKRPISWVHWIVLFLLLIAIGEYAAVTWLAPQYVIRVAERLAGGSLAVNDAHLSFPLTTTLNGVRLISNTPDALLSAQRVRIEPRWFSASTRTLFLDRIEIDRPHLRMMRTEAGTLVWPAWSPSVVTGGTALSGPLWRIHVESLHIEDGVIELIDYNAPTPFHGVLHHVSLVAGPLTIPFGGPQMSFAVRGEVVGQGGEGAPVYCSGWCDAPSRDLRASCKMEPLALSAFESYFQQGNVKVRVYNATVKSTSQWMAHANDLEGRIQVELGNLSEGDLSVHGRTVVDVKKLTEGEPPQLSAEFKITGPLDNPSAWRSDFVPGNEQVQQLVKPLLDRGIEMIRIPFGGAKFGVSITTANPDTMNGIEQTSKQVDRELEILSTTVPSTPSPSSATPPAAVSPGAASSAVGEPPAAPPTPAPVESPAPAATSAPPTPQPPSVPSAPAKASAVQGEPAPAVPSSAPSSDSSVPSAP